MTQERFPPFFTLSQKIVSLLQPFFSRFFPLFFLDHSKVRLPSSVSLLPLVPRALSPSHFQILETTNGKRHLINWSIEPKEEVTVVQKGPTFSSLSSYSKNMDLRSYTYTTATTDCQISQDEQQKKVHCFLQQKGHPPIHRSFSLKHPLLQQRAIGLHFFLNSSHKTARFQSVVPEIPPLFQYLPLKKPPFLIDLIAEKKSIESSTADGNLLVVEVRSTWGFPYDQAKSLLWFRTHDWQLVRFEDQYGAIFSQKKGILQKSQSPELKHL